MSALGIEGVLLAIHETRNHISNLKLKIKEFKMYSEMEGELRHIKNDIQYIKKTLTDSKTTGEHLEDIEKLLQDIESRIGEISYYSDRVISADDKNKLEDSIEKWKGDLELILEHIVSTNEFFKEYQYIITLAISVSDQFDLISYQIHMDTSISRILGNIEILKGRLINIYKFVRKEGIMNLDSKIQDIVKDIDILINELNRQKEFDESTKQRIQRFIERWNSPIHSIGEDIIHYIAIYGPRKRAVSSIRISVDGQTFEIQKEDFPFILGRYAPPPGGRDPPNLGPAHCLAIKTENKKYFLFTDTRCRWGCGADETDCTSREHVWFEISNDARQVIITNIGRGPVYITRNGEKTEVGRQGIPIHARTHLHISGVYDIYKTRKVDIIIDIIYQKESLPVGDQVDQG
ncbi:MAG: hypothetical protein LZ173_10625 [Thaumarchaeota archaeon]|jgi:cell fate (sporulation/competence/biofilm development) regulator YmcA (YheA/YmcA/DUF963 family)|nr:hypothetical protein [Candidatus Geocrenenecus arthurdayi]